MHIHFLWLFVETGFQEEIIYLQLLFFISSAPFLTIVWMSAESSSILSSPLLSFSIISLTDNVMSLFLLATRISSTLWSAVVVVFFSPKTHSNSSILPRLTARRLAYSANTTSLCSEIALVSMLAIKLDCPSSRSILRRMSFSKRKTMISGLEGVLIISSLGGPESSARSLPVIVIMQYLRMV